MTLVRCNYIMEKYRRWTDETAGINPFVAANVQSVSFIKRALSLVTLLAKGSLFIAYLPLFVVLTILPINFARKASTAGLLLLLGVYEHEDFSLQKADKRGKSSIILSNHTCFIDIVYFIYRFPGCPFLGFNEDKDGRLTYYTVSPLKAIISLFTSLQAFYRISEDKGLENLKQLYAHSSHLKNGGKLIVFYEKIRTNGRGTIRIDRTLAEQIYELEKDVIVTQIKYTVKKDTLFSLTTSAASVLCSALGTLAPGNNIKLRATRLDYKDTHSANELRDGVNTASTGALLETSPKSYFEFIQFYRKTQKEGYKLDE